MPSITFKLTDYAPTESRGWHWWRGWRFRVTEPIVVSSLIASTYDDDFSVALYGANGNTPTTLLAHSSCIEGVDVELPIEEVKLYPDNDYIIAMGGYRNQNRSIQFWDTEAMVDAEDFLTFWYPVSTSDDPHGCLCWHTSGDEGTILNNSPSASTSGRTNARPPVGFIYSSLTAKANVYPMVDNVWKNSVGVWTMVNNSWKLISAPYGGGTGQLLPVTCSSDDGTSTSGAMWVGYKFTVSKNIEVDRVYGGTSCIYDHIYYCGIYECSNNKATNLLGYARVPNETRGFVTLSSPITLQSGNEYIIAIGSVDCAQTGTNFAHYAINPIDVNCMENQEIIDTWEPSSGYAMRWNGQGDETYIVNRNPDFLSSAATIPNIGFGFVLSMAAVTIKPKVYDEWK